MARVDLYYVFAIYLAFVFAIAIYIFFEKKNKPQELDNIGEHFLAGKNTNIFILCATTFSTIFSGYTMIGVPAEAYEDGTCMHGCDRDDDDVDNENDDHIKINVNDLVVIQIITIIIVSDTVCRFHSSQVGRDYHVCVHLLCHHDTSLTVSLSPASIQQSHRLHHR